MFRHINANIALVKALLTLVKALFALVKALFTLGKTSQDLTWPLTFQPELDLLGHRVKRDKPRGSNVGTDAELKEKKSFFSML